MERGTIVLFDRERRRKTLDTVSLDPIAIATRVCREMNTLSKGDRTCWIPIPILCKRLKLPQEAIVGAAVYGHIHGWVIYTPFSLLLRDEGRTFLCDIERPGQLSWEQEVSRASTVPRATRD